MANAARGEADIEIGGRSYAVTMNMGALAGLASALGVDTFKELQERLLSFKLPDMPVVVAAILKANGHEVERAAIDGMDPMAYFNRVIPAIFRSEKNGAGGDGEGNPRQPNGRAKR